MVKMKIIHPENFIRGVKYRVKLKGGQEFVGVFDAIIRSAKIMHLVFCRSLSETSSVVAAEPHFRMEEVEILS